MSLISDVFNRHARLVRSNPAASILILATFLVVVSSSYVNHVILHGLGYIFAVWLCAFVTDIVVLARPLRAKGFNIKKPLRSELVLILISTLLSIVFLTVRFYSDWNHIAGIVKLMLMPLLLFTFPIVLAIVYLFVYKYKPGELGINLNYWYLPLPVILIFGAITLTLAPGNSHWTAEYKQDGLVNMLFLGFIDAALPEEFLRMLLQTRLAKALNNAALGLVLAACLWALMHIPNFSQDYKTAGFSPGIIGAIRIVPLGLLWGYIIHRTKSIIPSTIIHGLNLWGLQWM